MHRNTWTLFLGLIFISIIIIQDPEYRLLQYLRCDFEVKMTFWGCEWKSYGGNPLVPLIEVRAYFSPPLSHDVSLMIQTGAKSEHVDLQTGFWNTAHAFHFLRRLRKRTQSMFFSTPASTGDPKTVQTGTRRHVSLQVPLMLALIQHALCLQHMLLSLFSECITIKNRADW